MYKNNQKGGDSSDEEQYTNQNGSIGFDFADVGQNNKKLITLGQYNPNIKYNTVYPGLNLRGICKNQVCDGFNKNVWVKKQFGIFRIAEQLDNSFCPACSQQLPYQTIKTLGYMKCRVKVEGRKLPSNQKYVWEDSQNEGKFAIFEGYDGQTVQWSYLNLTVTQL